MRYVDRQFELEHPELVGFRPYTAGVGLAAVAAGVTVYGRSRKSTPILLGGLGLMALSGSRLLAAVRRVQAAARVYNFDFVRNSQAYRSDGVMVSLNIPRFESGKFEQAVMVEEGTTNLVTDTATLANHSLWTSGATTEITDLGSTISNGLAHVYFRRTGTTGSDRRLITSTSSTTYPFTIDKTKNYTVTIKFKLIQAASNPQFYIRGTVVDDTTYSEKRFATYDRSTHAVTGENGAVVLKNELLPDGYRRIVVRIPASFWTGSGNTCLIGVYTAWTQVGVHEYYYEKPQLEQKPYGTSWCVGTRSPEILTIPTAGVLSPQEGTVEVWVYPYVYPYVTATRIFIAGPNPWDANKSLQLIIDPTSGKWRFTYGYGTGYTILLGPTAQTDTWTHLAIRWNPSGGALFVNGTKQAELSTPPVLELTQCHIGNWYDGTQQLNGLIDDLRISSRARTDEEILAAYRSGQPLPVDGYTTKKLSFDIPQALAAARQEYALR